ncbi:MAG: Histidinol dehydrogenase [Phycisphaerae bacterium]|nr:Histidinol dehydrogenase [Phycisphaerae bacterium]
MAIAIYKLSEPAGLAGAEALLGRLRMGTALVAGGGKVGAGREDPAQSVARIIDAVRDRGDAALIELTERFDKARLSADRLRVSAAELAAAREAVDPKFLTAARIAIANIREYQAHILPKPPAPLKRAGMSEGLRLRPMDRIGCYVPGGAASYPSSVMMLAVPAQVAGVKEVVIVSPPRAGGDISPLVLATCAELGIAEVYRVGGAQAIAALALGTKGIPRVDKIVGPGNLFVQLAKKQLYGQVDIDSFAGPSEVLIVADASADPAWLAADLLAQAEHNPGCGLLVTADAKVADAVAAAIERLLPRCSRREAIEQSLAQWSAILVADSLDQAVEWADRVAPEHLEVATADADAVADRIRHAGVVFIGPHTPVATGDYIAGSSHVLPTGGTARYFAGLSVYDFLRPQGVVRYDAAGLRAAADDIAALAEAEGLDAHSLSVRIRFEQERK